MAIKINLKNNIDNTSLQIGDSAYFVELDNATSITNSGDDETVLIGVITSIGIGSITINNVYPGGHPPDDAFIMFQKDRKANDTSLLGYYAKIELHNNSTEKAELFALGSEVTISSK